MPIAPDLCGIALEDRYELLELIGEGAFGCVYRGRDRRLDRAVAVKVIKPWWSEDPAWVATFERETRMLARVSDPGIVQIHDVGRASEGLYYVSELVVGGNLADRLRSVGGGLPVPEARRIAIGLCRALGAAHTQRVVHRDVKPANVLLGQRGGAHPVVKVADFGVARLAEGAVRSEAESGDAPSLVLGTPRYMAPEQGRGGPVTPATDVYAAGVVLYEMLAGHPPFDGDTAAELAPRHRDGGAAPLLAHVPGSLRRIVARALATEPADRYADGGEMAAALHAGVAGHPAPASGSAPARRSPGVATRPQPRRGPRRDHDPAARRRGAALVALVALLVGGLIAGALTLGHGGHRHGARAAAARSVEVPLLVNESATDASATLRARHLRVRVRPVPAPGIRPGTVTSQFPVAGGTARAGSTVTLEVAEVPRWRTVASFTGRASGPIAIRGERWRIVAVVRDASHCAVLGLFCHHTGATVLRRPSGDSVVSTVSLGDSSTGAVHVLATGPGIYRVTVDPASGSTRWTIRVQDDY